MKVWLVVWYVYGTAALVAWGVALLGAPIPLIVASAVLSHVAIGMYLLPEHWKEEGQWRP